MKSTLLRNSLIMFYWCIVVTRWRLRPTRSYTQHTDIVLFRFCFYYRPQTKLRKGNVFTPVCDSVHGGRGVRLKTTPGQTPPGQTPARQTTPYADPSSKTAIAVDGTHPTGMHSCLLIFSVLLLWFLLILYFKATTVLGFYSKKSI